LIFYSFPGGVVSGSYNLALVMARYRQNLARAIVRPVGPAMAAMVGRGDLSSLRRLVLVADKYAAIGTLYFVVPVLLETELIFRLWLPRNIPIPAATALLVRLILIWMSIKVLTRGHDMAMIALGRLAGFVTPVAMMSFGTLVLAAVGFHAFDLGPWALPATAIGMNILINLFIVGYVGWRIDLGYRQWWQEAVLPALGVMIMAGAPAWSLRWLMPPDWQRLVAVLVVYGVIATAVAWTVAMQEWERAHFRRVLTTGARVVLSRLGKVQ
jgi:hypothetical protein